MIKDFIKKISIYGDIEDALSRGEIELVNMTIEDKNLDRFFCHQVQGRMTNGNYAFGMGADKDFRKSILKAYVEYIERSAFYRWGLMNGFESTNGIAGHRFFRLAYENAIAEIHERDSFLLHWYLGVPFASVNSGVLSKLRLGLDSKSGYFLLFKQTTLGSLPCIACFIVNKSTGGFVVGLSSGKGEKGDCEKAYSEAVINLIYGGYGRETTELENLKKRGFSKLDHHRLYWLYLDFLPDWVLESADTKPASNVKSQGMLKNKIKFRKKFKNVCVVGVKAFDNLEIILGTPGEKEISILRKRENCDIEPLIDVIGRRPHPIP